MIGRIFTPIWAIEAIIAFILKNIMVNVFVFNWNEIRIIVHLTVTFFIPLDASLLIVNILAKNSLMKHATPRSTLDFMSITMNVYSIVNPCISKLAQVRVTHIANVGFATDPMFAAGISA